MRLAQTLRATCRPLAFAPGRLTRPPGVATGHRVTQSRLHRRSSIGLPLSTHAHATCRVASSAAGGDSTRLGSERAPIKGRMVMALLPGVTGPASAYEAGLTELFRIEFDNFVISSLFVSLC